MGQGKPVFWHILQWFVRKKCGEDYEDYENIKRKREKQKQKQNERREENKSITRTNEEREDILNLLIKLKLCKTK